MSSVQKFKLVPANEGKKSLLPPAPPTLLPQVGGAPNLTKGGDDDVPKNTIRAHAEERQRKLVLIIMKLASIRGYDAQGHIRRKDGSYMEDTEVIPLVLYAVTKDKLMLGMREFVELLIEAGVTEDDVLNENLRHKLARSRGTTVNEIEEQQQQSRRPRSVPVPQPRNERERPYVPPSVLQLGKRSRMEFEDGNESEDSPDEGTQEPLQQDEERMIIERREKSTDGEPSRKRRAVEDDRIEPQDVFNQHPSVSRYLPKIPTPHSEPYITTESSPQVQKNIPTNVKYHPSMQPYHSPGIGFKPKARPTRSSRKFVPNNIIPQAKYHPSMNKKTGKRKQRVWNRSIGAWEYVSSGDED